MHPYHQELGESGSAGEQARRRGCEAARRVSRQVIRALVNEMRRHGLEPSTATVVARSLADPARIGGAHARAHAEERRLYREAVEAALRGCGLEVVTLVENTLRAAATKRLGRGTRDLNAALKAFSHKVGTPWRAPEKNAALAAWLALSRSHGRTRDDVPPHQPPRRRECSLQQRHRPRWVPARRQVTSLGPRTSWAGGSARAPDVRRPRSRVGRRQRRRDEARHRGRCESLLPRAHVPIVTIADTPAGRDPSFLDALAVVHCRQTVWGTLVTTAGSGTTASRWRALREAALHSTPAGTRRSVPAGGVVPSDPSSHTRHTAGRPSPCRASLPGLASLQSEIMCLPSKSHCLERI
jgi:hypothetical protein